MFECMEVEKILQMLQKCLGQNCLRPQIIFACLAAVALARPQTPDSEAETILDERSDNGDGNFQYTFQTSNGISSSNTGTPGSEGQSNMQGTYR